MKSCLYVLVGVMVSSLPSCNRRTVAGQVLDETGSPVGGATVISSWSVGRGFDVTHGPSDNFEEKTTTDKKGYFSARASTGHFGLKVGKPNFYETEKLVSNSEASDHLVISINRVLSPQAMVGKKTSIRLPVGLATLQYDFLVGDLLPPNGHGQVADLQIKWNRPSRFAVEENKLAFEARIIGEGNGLVAQRVKQGSYVPRSRLRSWHEAPKAGYVPSFTEADNVAGGFTGEYYGADVIYYVRIRSSSQGGPFYGKMLGRILYSPTQGYPSRPSSDKFEFTYVINPSGSPALEIDPKRVTAPSKGKFEAEPPVF